MGNENLELSPAELQAQVRALAEEAGRFSDQIEKTRQGFRDAASGGEPWFSAGGWGMFRQPARAAADADGFTGQVIGDVDAMRSSLAELVRDLSNTDVNSGTELGEVYPI